MNRYAPRSQRGVSLIEVLVAVLVFSVGMIGVAGLLIMATRSNHTAYLRTQAAFLASNMGDRMSANPVGVWMGNYDSSSYPVSASTAANNDCSAGCTPDALAQSDQRAWSRQLKTFLPQASARIRCDKTNAGYTPDAWVPPSASTSPTAPVTTPGQIGMRPPYGGTCSMHISWYEQDSLGPSSQQTFDWEFQP
ncbi:MAG TPA: type IV pilus modification protein PilV [Frateuria sp.]|uniref:type IV pilus modification protein PilV n=1 Tax=Frateuria sp. TaxID=2211372 RepID=UPI002DE67DD2|nr:type IV pilus modification protein PilV [Frateuria sp.]